MTRRGVPRVARDVRATVGLLSLLALLAPTARAADLPRLSYNPEHAEVVRFLSAAAAASPFITVASIGNSVRGRQIPVAILHDPSAQPLTLKRVLVLARQHGNEPAGTLATLELIRDLATGEQSQLPPQLSKVCLIIVPMVNPDGADANRRANAASVDLNRDWTARSQPETQAVERLFHLWKPHCVLDLHELHWHDRHGLNTIEAPSEGATVEALGDEARALQSYILQRLEDQRFPVRPSFWDGSNNGSLCHRHYARDHRVTALLFESERQNLQTPLPRRTQMHRIGLQTVLDYYFSDGFGRGTFQLAMAPGAGVRGVLPRVTADNVDRAMNDQPSRRGTPVLDAQAAAARETQVRGARNPAPAGAPKPAIEVLGPDLDKPIARGGVARVRLRLSGVPNVRYLVAKIDGQGRYFANRAPFEFEWDTDAETPGRHVMLIQAVRTDGAVVEREVFFTLGD